MDMKDLEDHVDSIYKLFMESGEVYQKADAAYEEAKAKLEAAKTEHGKWVARFDDMRKIAYALGTKRSW